MLIHPTSTPPHMLIRPTEESDWERLKSIRLAALRDAPTAFGVSHAQAASNSDEQWKTRASGATLPRFWLAVDGDEAVGLAGGGIDQAGRYNLIAMWVAPAQRGSDAARRLVDAVKAHARELAHARVVLDVDPDNSRRALLPARRLRLPGRMGTAGQPSRHQRAAHGVAY
jgi:ribosomal protein S18 acetylase RimI-like enzyme